jgi:hypothetical protein
MKTFGRIRLLITLGAWALSLVPAEADETVGHIAHDDHVESRASTIFSDGMLQLPGGKGHLVPTLHVLGAFGGATFEQEELAVNDHDPQREGFTLQTFEPGLNLHAGSLFGFANASGTTDGEGDFSFKLEEAYLGISDLPGDLRIRGGQLLSSFGFQNATHNHEWDYVDQNLVNGRLLNEGELIVRGGELAWEVPLHGIKSSLLTLGGGEVVAHAHGHSGGDDHGEEHEEFELESASFEGALVSGSWQNLYQVGDSHSFTSIVSGIWGDNEMGGDSQIYGLGLEYLWNEPEENSHGRFLRWRNEVMLRSFEVASDHHHEHHAEEESHEEEDLDGRYRDWGVSSSIVYGVNERFNMGLRGDWLSEIKGLGVESRWRFSPTATYYLDSERRVRTRLQYNYDRSDDFGAEHSVWFQVGFSWGDEHHH